jgi:hypothetical protein
VPIIALVELSSSFARNSTFSAFLCLLNAIKQLLAVSY